MRTIFVAVMGLLILGCTHNLEIINQHDYFSSPSAVSKGMTLGITSTGTVDPQKARYVNAIVNALRNTGAFTEVIYPYDSAVHTDPSHLTVAIGINPVYSGSGANYWKTFPGFLIWAPKIFGYSYNAEIQTFVQLKKNSDRTPRKMDFRPKYKIRQAEKDRTWLQLGWFEVGLIPFFGGFGTIRYDKDITDDFITAVSPSYGTYVANEILARVLQRR